MYNQTRYRSQLRYRENVAKRTCIALSDDAKRAYRSALLNIDQMTGWIDHRLTQRTIDELTTQGIITKCVNGDDSCAVHLTMKGRQYQRIKIEFLTEYLENK